MVVISLHPPVAPAAIKIRALRALSLKEHHSVSNRILKFFMTGVILCGGASSRMGSDKGLLLRNGKHWVMHTAALMKDCGLSYVVSVAGHNILDYQQVLPGATLICDDPSLQVGGPLKGILSVNLAMPAEDLLVLAVDMQEMKPYFLQQIIDASKENDAQAILFKHDDQVEPLCAWYRADGLHHVLQLVLQGLLQRFSMHHVLSYLKTKIIPVGDDPAFLNFNTPEDLSQL